MTVKILLIRIEMAKITHPQFSPSGFIPTAEQRDIQLSHSRVALIEANAGAAKTTTLALRIGESLARGLSPGSILALTFTPEARQVMKARLVEIGIAPSVASRIHVQTMDDFSCEVLANIVDTYPSKPASDRILRDTALKALETVSRIYAHKADLLDIRMHNMAVSQFLDTLLRMKATMAFDYVDTTLDLEFVAEDMGVTLTDYLWAREYEKYRVHTFFEVQHRGPLDATYDLARILRDEPEMRLHLPFYRLVVVDELHDMNEASFRTLEALLEQDRLYFVGAGDRDQVIHSKFGADEKFLRRRFSERFPYVKRYPLTMTYRHGPHLAYAMQAFKEKSVDSALVLHTRIEILTYSDRLPGECANRVVQALHTWNADGRPLDRCAILLRDRYQSIEIENALINADISYRTETMPSYLMREEIMFLRGILAIALNDLNAVQSSATRGAIVEALAIFSEVPLSPIELEEAKRIIARTPETLQSFYEGQIQRVGNEAARTRISHVVQVIHKSSPEMPAYEVLQNICNLLDIEALARRVYVHRYDAAVVTRSIEGFIAVTRFSGMNLHDFYSWLNEVEAFVLSSNRRKNLVILECAAHSKGKEFDHVILPFMEDEEFPNSMSDLQEEKNLFYVAATRACSRLTLITPLDEARRSSFLSQMQLDQTRSRAETILQRRREAPLPTNLVRQDLKVNYDEHEIVKGLGANWDPVRRVWYLRPGQDIEPFRSWIPRG